MEDDLLKHLYDIKEAAAAMLRFVRGKTFDDYEQDELLRSGVERKFEIIGEALNRLRRDAPTLLDNIREHRNIVSFRNILAHGYDSLDNRIVWGIIEEDLGKVLQDVEQLLAEEDRTSGCTCHGGHQAFGLPSPAQVSAAFGRWERIVRRGETVMSSEVERSATRVRGFDDPEMDFQLIRMLGTAPYGGAALGECLTAARQIADGNPWSWARAFGELAVRLEARAWDCFRAGHRVSARELFLRTSNYYRSAEYYANPRLPEHHHFGMKARECFLQAAPLCREVIEVLGIPFEGSALPAYFLRPDADRSPRKTLLVISGF